MACEKQPASGSERHGVPAETVALLSAACGGDRVAGAVVLGSGLGILLDAWQPEAVIAAEEVPGFPRSGVSGHAGRVAIVRWGRARGLVFQGRVHFYEGYQRSQVTFAVRLAAALGARWILLTNASGAVDPRLAPGSVLVIEDHFHLFMGDRCARGAVPACSRSGSPYHAGRAEQAFSILCQEGLRTMRGVLYGGLGPSYETAAEVEMIRRIGASAACMSTVVEAEEAARLGLEVAAVSLVTNLATGLAARPLAHSEVVAMAERVATPLARALDRLVRCWAGD